MKLVQNIFLITLMALGSAQAASIQILSVDANRFGNVKLNIDGANSTHSAGVIQASYDGGPVLDLFCVDLFTNITYDTYTSNDVAPNPLRNEDRAAWLYENYYDPAIINTKAEGIAFQVAIWDIVHDGGDGISSGRIRSQSGTEAAVVTAWQSFLTASVGQSYFGVNIYINSKNNIPAQNLIGGIRDVPPPPMAENPEPGTVAMLAAGLGVLYWKRRRPC